MSKQFDWTAEIGRLILIKQEMATHDSDGVFPFHLPQLAAAPSAIDDAESHLRMRFPEDFRNFLAVANGWIAILVCADVFGTAALVSKRDAILSRPDVCSYLEDSGMPVGHVLPIGASDLQRTVFLLLLASGEIVWLDCEEVERFSSFQGFFQGIVQHNVELAEEVKEGRWSL
jgi:hypothetical protein